MNTRYDYPEQYKSTCYDTLASSHFGALRHAAAFLPFLPSVSNTARSFAGSDKTKLNLPASDTVTRLSEVSFEPARPLALRSRARLLLQLLGNPLSAQEKHVPALTE